ncbi:MAG: flagellar basal body rod C-terminal domain-containing protein [Candidatus Tectomicrobia bacterium]
MLSALSSALSGLSAFTKQIGTAAHNTANANTAGFKKSRVVLEETRPQGVQARIETINTPGPLLLTRTQEGDSLVEQSNVDIAEEAVAMILAKRAYQANLSTLKAEVERRGSLLDIIE